MSLDRRLVHAQEMMDAQTERLRQTLATDMEALGHELAAARRELAQARCEIRRLQALVLATGLQRAALH